MFWRDWSARNSVLALRELQKQCFGMTGVPEIVFWRCGSCKTVFWRDESARNSVLALRELQKQCFGATEVPEIVFWHCGSCENSVWAPWHQERGFGGVLPPILGHTWPPGVKSVWYFLGSGKTSVLA